MIRLETLHSGPRLSTDDSLGLHLQPKRLALLVYLAMSPLPKPRSRDELMAMFWPEMSDAPARGALRQAVHYLRTELGRDVLVGEGADRIGLDAGRFQCDAVEFDRAMDGKQPAQALLLYGGEFLAGFYFQEETTSFEAWIEHERTRLRQRAVAAAQELARREERRGNVPGAVHWIRRALDLDPFAETELRRLVELLWRMDDRAGAMDAFHAFAERLFKEYGVPVSAETRRIIHAIESGSPNGPPASDAAERNSDAYRRLGGEIDRMTRLIQDLGDLAGRGLRRQEPP